MNAMRLSAEIASSMPWAQHLVTRVEHSLTRGLPIFTGVAHLWLYLLLWTLLFVLVAALSAIADIRLISELRQGRLRMLVSHLSGGLRVFVGLLRDRQTPALARFILGVALAYWLSSPWEVFPQDWGVPGFLDELLVTVAATKGFIYLCPEWLVRRYAAPRS